MRCPVCRAENTETACRRCRADLSLLWGLEAQRRALVGQAREALRRGDGPGAARLANQAQRLRADREGLTLQALAALLRRDFAAARAYHRQLTEAVPG